MILVLASHDDDAAQRLVTSLHDAGACARLITVECLAAATHRALRVDDQGLSTRIVLADGTVLDPTTVSGVVNRLAPDDWFRGTSTDATWQALADLLPDWLAGLRCPIRNQPHPRCLAGPAPHPTVAMVEAARCGLDGRSRLASRVPARRVRVTWLDGVAYAPIGVRVPDRVAAASIELLGRLDAAEAMVGVDYVVEGDAWVFLGLDPIPDLPAGEAFTGHVRQLLGGRTVPVTVTTTTAAAEMAMVGAR